MVIKVNNGILIQFATFNRSGYSATNQSHTYPIAFTTIPKVFIQTIYTGDHNVFFGVVKTGSVTKTGFIQGYSIPCFWLAIGF